MLRSIARVCSLVVAVLACAATSYVYDEVDQITPLPGETAVPVDTVPTVRTTTELSFDAADVTLVRDADEAPVAGQVVHEVGDDGLWHLRFVPDAPLEPDTDYRWRIRGALDGYGYLDPITNDSEVLGDLDVPFSTASDPRVRFSRRFAGHSHIYLSFSQDMDPATIEPATVEVYLDGALAPPLAFEWDSGPAHRLDIRVRRVDFQVADIVFGEGVTASDGTPMAPQLIEVPTR